MGSSSPLHTSQSHECASKKDMPDVAYLAIHAGIAEDVIHGMNALDAMDETENGEQNRHVVTGGVVSANGRASHGMCNSGSKSICEYKLVDDVIFSSQSLIGKFTRVYPNVQELSLWSKKHWLSKLKSIWVFKIIGQGFFKIEFYSREDCEFVLENGPWCMGAAGLSLKRWSPDFDAQNPGPLKTPIWVILRHLPLQFWSEQLLVKICSVVGKVLKISEATKGLRGQVTRNIAKVCVEVDLSKELPSEVSLRVLNDIYTQDLDYDGIPFRCRVCGSLEHTEGPCIKDSIRKVNDG